MNDLISRRDLGKAAVAAAATAFASGTIIRPERAEGYSNMPITGQTHMSPAVERAWRNYLEALETCRRFIFSCEFSDRPQIRAEAAEFLMQAQAASYSWIMAPRVDYPRFYVNSLT